MMDNAFKGKIQVGKRLHAELYVRENLFGKEPPAQIEMLKFTKKYIKDKYAYICVPLPEGKYLQIWIIKK